MVKLKRYLGLAVAIALLVFAFLPNGNSGYRLKATQVTRLDNTILAHVANVGGRGSYLWMVFYEYLQRCSSARSDYYRVDNYCSLETPVLYSIAKSKVDSIIVAEPRINEFLKEYSDADAADPRSTMPPTNLFGQPQVRYTERLVKAHEHLGQAISKYLDSQRSTLAFAVYLAHGLAIAAFLLLVRLRETVGGLLLWPFTLLLGAGKVGGKAAKAIHEKV